MTMINLKIGVVLGCNISKCCTLHYGHDIPNHTYKMYENGVPKDIRNSDTEKSLGLTFDIELKFRRHIHVKDCINKGNRVTGLIRGLFLQITSKSFGKLYKTLIWPHLEYGNIIWSPRLEGY